MPGSVAVPRSGDGVRAGVHEHGLRQLAWEPRGRERGDGDEPHGGERGERAARRRGRAGGAVARGRRRCRVQGRPLEGRRRGGDGKKGGGWGGQGPVGLAV